MRQYRSVGVKSPGAARQKQVRREIKAFLEAVNSYPDRFVKEPYLSFQQHLYSVESEQYLLAEGRRNQT